MRLGAAFLIGLFMSIGGCGEQPRVNTDPLASKKQLDELSAKVAALEARLSAMESSQQLEQSMSKWGEIAYITPGEAGYSLIKSDLGILTVSMDDVKPYANGSKVVLRFGNIYSATINGLKAKIEWGSVDKDGSPDNENERSKEISLIQPMTPGAWNRLEVVLEGVPPSALGFVRVKGVEHSGLALRK